MAELKKFKRFIPFAKIDESKREVYGVVTSEAPDSDGEICDYKTTKPFYEKWSEGFAKATDGKSLGNVREMHQNIAAGKVTRLEFDDKAQVILAVSKIVDDSTWKKCSEGVLTGYSHGGRYEGEPWADGEFMRYTANPTEISVVDMPANPEARFEYVKSDGSTEMRKFADLAKKKTKRVSGKDLPASEFAYVGDANDTSTWKLPIHDAAHVRNALARFNQTKGIPEGEKDKVHARIVAAAKKFGIEVSEKAASLIAEFTKKHVQKGMYEVSRFAELLQGLYWLALSAEAEREWEADDSEVPEELRGHIEELCSTFEEMTTEEVKELVSQLTATGGKELYMSEKTADLQKAAHSLSAHFKKAASHHEKMAKAHESHAEHLHKMAEACAEQDHEKAAALFAEITKSAEGIEPEKKVPVTEAAKIADAEIEKRVNERVKPIEEGFAKMNESLKKLLADPEAPKVAKTTTAAVTKEQDGKTTSAEPEQKPQVITRGAEMAGVLKGVKPVENAVIPSR